MPDLKKRVLERLRYGQGQMILSRDFRDQQEIEEQLRAWHNRALHNAYGIAAGVLEGLEVREETIDQIRGVTVKSGGAYDCFGRTILLQERQFVPFDEKSEPMVLTLRYKQSDSDQPATDRLVGCCPSGNSVAASDAELVWQAVEDFSVRDGVSLAKTKINKKTVSLDTDFVPRHSRPLSRPRIVTGATIPGATTWEVWDLGAGTQDLEVGAQVQIDTSSAGFTTRPAYFASLQGSLVVQDEQKNLTAIGLHLDHVDQATSDSFLFRFLLRVVKPRHDKKAQPQTDIREFLQQQNAYVSWLGIEPSRNDQTNTEYTRGNLKP